MSEVHGENGDQNSLRAALADHLTDSIQRVKNLIPDGWDINPLQFVGRISSEGAKDPDDLKDEKIELTHDQIVSIEESPEPGRYNFTYIDIEENKPVIASVAGAVLLTAAAAIKIARKKSSKHEQKDN